MTFSALVLSAFRRRPLRSLLTACGIGIALGTFLCFQSLSRGLENSWSGTYLRSGTDIIVAQDNVFNSTLDQRIGAQIRVVPGVHGVTPIVWGLSTVDGRPGTPLTGWEPNSFGLATLSVRGRRFAAGASEAMLGAYVARRLGKEIGDRITVSGERLTIVGIFTSPSLLELESVYVPIDLLQRIRGSPGIVGAFHVAVEHPREETNPRATVDRVMRTIQTGFPRLAAYRTDEFARSNEIISMARATAWSTSVVAFGVAVLGVVNTMSMVVLERTREIGLLRALGWRRQRVLTMLVWESVSLAVVGGGAGILLGVAGLRVLAQVPRMRLLAISHVPSDLFVLTMLLAVVLGLAGGVLPAYRATQISPVEALRYE